MKLRLGEMKNRIGLLRYPLILIGTLVASVCVAATVFAADINTVVVNYNGELMELTSDGGTVGEALLKAGIVLKAGDVVSCDTDTLLADVDKIEIVNKNETVLSVPGQLYEFPEISYQPIVFDSVELSSRSGLDADVPAEASAKAPEAPVETSYETVEWAIEFDTEYQADSEMYEGDSKVVQQGENGSRTVEYVIRKQDGEVISKDIASSEVTKEPVKKIVIYGTKKRTVTSKGLAVQYTGVYSSFKATAYTADAQWGHATASGLYAKMGVIAVDPSVIPMGTKVYVEGLNGASDYGYAIAGDTGGSIKGNIIDLYMNDESTCNRWGVKYVNIYVLEDQSVDVFSLR